MTAPHVCIIDGSGPVAEVVNNLPMWRCTTCALMWRREFDVSLGHYEEMEGGFSERKRQAQMRNIKDRIYSLKPHMDLNDLCDIGGSKGYFIESLITMGYSNVHGIDPNKIQVAAAQERHIPMHYGSTADVTTIFSELGIRQTTLFHVIEHLPEPAHDFRKIFQALPPEGHIVVETPDFSSPVFTSVRYKHRLICEEHLFYFTFENLQGFLRSIGFEIVHASKRDFDPDYLTVQESRLRLGFPSHNTLLDRIINAALSTTCQKVLARLAKRSNKQSFSLIIARKPKPRIG